MCLLHHHHHHPGGKPGHEHFKAVAQESHGDVLEAENTCFLAEKKIRRLDFFVFFFLGGIPGSLLKPRMFFFLDGFSRYM